ncbi:MAG: YeeE/YedE family protein [Chloroflexi bacterium]|nr:YeeE/YedE family protein [Chloroflexota bacterium]MBI4314759.1 YeeE/YedE family protein [Chloroflexota bacterium]MBI5291671.1 YeeE/YedE family protein [Chloroflexota bacterium]
MNQIVQYIRREEWSPYVAGVLLGIVGVLAVLLSNSLLGASGAFENLAGLVGKALAPKVFDNVYFNFVMPPGITWGVILLVGVFFGGMAGAWTSGTLQWGKKDSANSDSQWKRIFGPQTWKRWALAFFGAIVLEYGAGIAGGCTSGLAISGGMLLAPAAYLFIAGMFASGIVTALIVYRRRY